MKERTKCTKQLNPHGDEEYATLLQRQGRIMRKQILVL
jgi:hypothetical protein